MLLADEANAKASWSRKEETKRKTLKLERLRRERVGLNAFGPGQCMGGSRRFQVRRVRKWNLDEELLVAGYE